RAGAVDHGLLDRVRRPEHKVVGEATLTPERPVERLPGARPAFPEYEHAVGELGRRQWTLVVGPRVRRRDDDAELVAADDAFGQLIVGARIVDDADVDVALPDLLRDPVRVLDPQLHPDAGEPGAQR